MSRWIVVPVKAPGAGKSRLAASLDEDARRVLVAAMLGHVMDVAAQAGADAVLLLGPSRHGHPDTIRRLADAGAGLNAALADAVRVALAEGIERLAFVSADLPLATAADLAALIDVPPASMAIAPDRAGTGTNALSLPLATAAGFAFQYGPGSFVRHVAEAGRLGLAVRVIRSPTLALDIDVPADLAAMRR